ncbi:hypothetical protein RRG08_003307 [Elysia crispata]|uniref:Secreted protein n=1 Tax=Elysia crispata TaxID=231223 RepID=A0AAE0ZS30_9GAST|nr:hypothetical protein RRG08_003307 [Elysia crispata]
MVWLRAKCRSVSFAFLWTDLLFGFMHIPKHVTGFSEARCGASSSWFHHIAPFSTGRNTGQPLLRGNQPWQGRSSLHVKRVFASQNMPDETFSKGNLVVPRGDLRFPRNGETLSRPSTES